jgi:hypothetical protein
MGDKHPYVGVTGALTQLFDQLRKSFPQKLDSDVLKKLGFAPKNESFVINVVRFLKLIDDKGMRTQAAQKIFTLHDNVAFQKAFGEIVKVGYSELFSLHGENTWSLGFPDLITYFRQANQSSDLVGKRQAGTFKALAHYAGHLATLPAKPSAGSSARRNVPAAKRPAPAAMVPKKPAQAPGPISIPSGNHVSQEGGKKDELGRNQLGLTVRVEINLPTTADQETYDKIFKSIRENLLNG